MDIFETMLPILLLRGQEADIKAARRAWAEFAVTHSLDEQYDFVERLCVEAAHFGYDSA